jgi:hypothetical protein
MTTTLIKGSEAEQWQEGVGKFRFAFDNLQDYVTCVARTLPDGSAPLTGLENGARCLVLGVRVLAGLFVVTNGSLVRCGDGCALSRTQVVLDTSTNNVYTIKPFENSSVTLGQGVLQVEQVASGTSSLVTFVVLFVL